MFGVRTTQATHREYRPGDDWDAVGLSVQLRIYVTTDRLGIVFGIVFGQKSSKARTEMWSLFRIRNLLLRVNECRPGFEPGSSERNSPRRYPTTRRTTRKE